MNRDSYYFSEDEINIVINKGFGKTAVDFSRVEEGNINQTFCINSGNSKYALKKHSTLNKELIKKEHKVMIYAEKMGVEAPIVFNTIEGDSIYFYNNSYWSLVEWMSGEIIPTNEINPKIAYNYGKTLGKAHKALLFLNIGLDVSECQGVKINKKFAIKGYHLFLY